MAAIDPIGDAQPAAVGALSGKTLSDRAGEGPPDAYVRCGP